MHYNGANSYLFVDGTEIIKFKGKDSEILAYSICLGNISKDWSIDNMKKTRFNGCIYDFSVDYDAILVCKYNKHSQVFDGKEWNSTCLNNASRFATYKNT